MRIISLVLLVVSCGVYEEKSEVGFITYPQIPKFSKVNFLISKVHEPSWTIGYLYETCDTPYPDIEEREAESELMIMKMLNVWLDVIRDMPSVKRKVVDSINFVNMRYREGMVATMELDFVVNFRCPTYTVSDRHSFVDPFKFPIEISLGSSHQRSYFTVLHELGHILGLMDTYGGSSTKATNSEYFDNTVGNQLPSVMSSQRFYRGEDYSLSNRDNSLTLTIDDKRGLEWLYLNYFTNKIKGPNDCYFPGYKLELLHSDGDKGCAPKNPLVFMLKNGYLTTRFSLEVFPPGNYRNSYLYMMQTSNFSDFKKSLLQLIEKDTLEELEEKMDDDLSLLHYAAMMPDSFGHDLFFTFSQYLPVFRPQINATDSKGETPVHYTIRAGNTRTLLGILYAMEETSRDESVGRPLHVSPSPYPQFDINKRLPNGMTYLHFAIQHAQVESVCLLLLHRSTNESIRDKWNLTPRQRANSRLRFWRSKGNQDMVNKMRKIMSVYKDRDNEVWPNLGNLPDGDSDFDGDDFSLAPWACGVVAINQKNNQIPTSPTILNKNTP